jgi:peptide/nickel transport system substrate-binding protein/oligopeptide transport system substrate-binding protein
MLAAACNDVLENDEQARVKALDQYGGIYRKGLEHEPRTLDPALISSTYEATVVQQVFDGLVQFDADLNVVPSIARSWKASPDGLVWTFELRPGVTFHNGREVTAADFVYSFTRLMHPKTRSRNAWIFDRVQGAKALRSGKAERLAGFQALDTYSLQIVLSQPYAPFIRTLGMAPAKVVPQEDVERADAPFGRQPVGTGAFRFHHWTAGQEIVLEANQTYFEGRPFLDQIRYRLFPGGDHNLILAAFEAGRLEDSLILPQERQRLMDNATYRIFRKPLLVTLFLWCDLRQGPLSHRAVRQAINLAINRDYIHRTIRHHEHVQARGVLPPGMPGYNPELPDYVYDVTQAKALLAQAGYPGGKGLPPLELWNSVRSPTALAEHEAIKNDLQQIGMTLELRQVDSWQHFSAKILGKRPGAMYRAAWSADFPDPDNFLFVLFHSRSPNNYAHYNNAEVDKLLQQARSKVDYMRRLELYRQAEKLIIADVPTLNLVHRTFERLFQPYVQGIRVNALGEPYIPMKLIWLDKTQDTYLKAEKFE